MPKTSSATARESEILMNKIRYFLKDNWEFERLVRYLRDHPDELAAAGEKLIDFSDLL